MEIADILIPERICVGFEATSKKRVMEFASRLLLEGSSSSITPNTVFDGLNARERLGSTGLGQGVALPHARLGKVDATLGAFVRIASGVDFDAPDRAPVDLVFALIVPEDSTDEHLQILARLAGLFAEASLREKLRDAASAETVFELLTP